MQRLPTVNDLRVKECYICREEETYDKPSRPPRRWVHPCKCTLIAHEECLLEWIRASETNPDKPLLLILKCPQCGERYKLESDNPVVLRVLDFGKRALQKCGTVVTVLTVVVGVSSIGTGVYILSAGYGAYAVRQFLGQEMYDLILGEDIEQWPLSAFFALPLIPFSLVLSKTKRFRDTLPLASLMSIWPSIPRISGVSRERSFLSFFGLASSNRDQPRVKYPASVNRISSDLFRDLFFSWPPSPFVFTVGLRFVRSIYCRRMEQYRQFILGDLPRNNDYPGDREGLLDNFQMEIRIEEEDDEQENEVPRAPQQPPGPAIANDQADQLHDDNNVRLLLDDAEEGPIAIEERPAEHAQLPIRNEPQEQQHIPAQNLERPAEGILEGRVRQADPPPNHNGDQRDERGANAAARVRLQLTTTYIGNVVGSALIVPPLASFAGSVLLRLALPNVPNAHSTLNFKNYSLFSPRRLLCRFLGVRPPGSAPNYPMIRMYSFPEDMSTGQVMRAMTLLSCRALVVGTPAWTGADPVWWRNAIGLGIFYVAKDLISIWYHYLSQREIRSRRVKDRAFEGISPTELDLKPEARELFHITSLTPNSMSPQS
ncbi:hypothetical protein ACEPAH_2461 [Sanghuangporus vaninii]